VIAAQSVNDGKPFCFDQADGFPAVLAVALAIVIGFDAVRVQEDASRYLEADFVLAPVAQRFISIPFKKHAFISNRSLHDCTEYHQQRQKNGGLRVAVFAASRVLTIKPAGNIGQISVRFTFSTEGMVAMLKVYE
jgi:hypothetical protein